MSEKTFTVSDFHVSFTAKLLHDLTDLDIEACWVRARMRTECLKYEYVAVLTFLLSHTERS
jgi:hypothetical protein